MMYPHSNDATPGLVFLRGSAFVSLCRELLHLIIIDDEGGSKRIRCGWHRRAKCDRTSECAACGSGGLKLQRHRGILDIMYEFGEMSYLIIRKIIMVSQAQSICLKANYSVRYRVHSLMAVMIESTVQVLQHYLEH